MKSVVCVKLVPDTEAAIRISSDGKSIDEKDVNFVLNPYDEYAVEEALRLKEKFGGTVGLLCLGGEGSTKALRTGLAMGADEAALIQTEKFNGDSLVTATLLADALKGMEFDLLLFGKQAMDVDQGQVGVMVAELLNLPSVSVVVKLEISARKAVAHREVEGGIEVVETPLPAVITAQKGLNEPRYPSLRGIMTAKKKEISMLEPCPVEPSIEVLKMEYPPSRPPGRIVGEGTDAVPELVRLLKEEAKVI
ncbi:electron transfer flavoprotein subunit beta/FixA family protein [candidate division KSB1 bacterium]|nr:electron transfer flavoprotein subunit beta/FixA family protein [candidate division KSB1 bacterium]